MLKNKILLMAWFSATPLAWSELSLEDRLYDLEAQVETLKSELASTKDQATQKRANTFNPSISVVGDVVGQYAFGDSFPQTDHDSFSNGLWVREVEFGFAADIDPYADASVVIGLHNHGHIHVHVEEAFARFKNLPGLGAGMIIKAGRFKPAIGRLNRVHLHNAPQIYYPQALRTFLGPEGYSSQGLSINLSFNPFEHSALNIFGEALFSSRTELQDENAEKMASFVSHFWWHQELTASQHLDIGLSTLLGREGAEKSGPFSLLAADLHYSFLPKGYGQDPMFLFGSEFYTASKIIKGKLPFSNFTWAQVRIFDGTFFGLLYDLAPKKDALDQFQHGMGAFLTYYTSEFLRFRLGYEHVMPNLNSFKGDERLMLSMNFIFGAHPVEPYFVNR